MIISLIYTSCCVLVCCADLNHSIGSDERQHDVIAWAIRRSEQSPTSAKDTTALFLITDFI